MVLIMKVTTCRSLMYKVTAFPASCHHIYRINQVTIQLNCSCWHYIKTLIYLWLPSYTHCTTRWRLLMFSKSLPAGAQHVSRVKLTGHREVYETFWTHCAASPLSTVLHCLIMADVWGRGWVSIHRGRSTFAVMWFNLNLSKVYKVNTVPVCRGTWQTNEALHPFENALFNYYHYKYNNGEQAFFFLNKPSDKKDSAKVYKGMAKGTSWQ